MARSCGTELPDRRRERPECWTAAGFGGSAEGITIVLAVRLLEREDDLGVLAEAVQDAVAGRGSVVLVAGEAGIGKSSLLRELRERAGERTTFLIGACEPLSVPVPLAPLRELVETAGGGDLVEAAGDDRLVLARRVASVLADQRPAGPAVRTRGLDFNLGLGATLQGRVRREIRE